MAIRITGLPSQQAAPKSGIRITSVPGQEEGGLKSAARTALQVPQGLLEGTVPGRFAAAGQLALNQPTKGHFYEEQQRERELAQEHPGEFGPGNFPQLQQEPFERAHEEGDVSQYAPSVSNIGRKVEEYTGIPLTPKTESQRAVRFLFSLGQAGGGTAADKARTAIVGAAATRAARGGIETEEELRQKYGIAPLLQLTPEEKEYLSYGASTPVRNLKLGAKPAPTPRQQQLPYQPPDVSGRTNQAIQNLSPGGQKFQSDYGMGSAVQQYAQQFQPTGAPTAPNAPELPQAPAPLPEPRVPRPQPPAAPQEPTRTRPVSTERLPQHTMIRPQQPVATMDKEDRIGHLISPARINNPVAGANSVRDLINQESELQYDRVNANYDQSRELNAQVNTIHPELVQQLERIIEQRSALTNRSAVSNRMIDIARNLVRDLAVRDAAGDVTAWRPVSNQYLINEVRELNKLRKFDFAHGDTGAEFGAITGPINHSIERAAEHANNGSLEAFQNARQSFIDWENTFGNQVVHPWLDLKDFKPETMFKRAVNLDDYLHLYPILEHTRAGRQISNGLRRQLVDQRLGPYLRKESGYNSKDFAQELQALEPVLTPHERQEISDIFHRAPLRGIRATNVTKAQEEARKRHKERISAHEKAVKKTLEERKNLEKKYKQDLMEWEEKHRGQRELATALPEKISDKLNTISGVKQFRKDMAAITVREPKSKYASVRALPIKKPKGEILVRDALDYKAADILHKGKILPSDKAKTMADLLNDKEIVSLLTELKSQEFVNDLRELSTLLQGEEEAFQKFLKNKELEFFEGKGISVVDFAKMIMNPTKIPSKTLYLLIRNWRYFKGLIQRSEKFLKEKGKEATHRVKGSTYAGKPIGTQKKKNSDWLTYRYSEEKK